MYLHIGNDIVLKKEKILFILDYETLQNNSAFNEFLKNLKKENIIDISSGKRKSIIITKEDNIIKGYISNISSNTLAKRKVL